MAAAQQPIVTSQVTEHERATFITQLYKLLQQIVQLSKNIVPDEALLLKCWDSERDGEDQARYTAHTVSPEDRGISSCVA